MRKCDARMCPDALTRIAPDGLSHNHDKFTSALSGGMKRKLMVALALILLLLGRLGKRTVMLLMVERARMF